MSETRVIGPTARKIGGGNATPAPPAAPPPAPAPARRGRKLLVVALIVLSVIGGAAAAYILLGPDDSDAAPAPPEPGLTVMVDARNVNLADGHYLRLGFAIELAADAEEIPTAQAIDIAIELYSGRSIDEINDPELREGLRIEFTDRLVEAYGQEVLAVYFTDFVTQ